MAGLEVLFASIQSQLKGKEDAIVTCLHWTIISQGLKCLGVGDQIPDKPETCKTSELLPAGWNASQDAYTLMYTQPDTRRVYLLKVIKMDTMLVTHFMQMNDKSVSDMMIDVSLYASGDNSSYDSAYQHIEELQSKFAMEVLTPVAKSTQNTPSLASENPPSSDQRSHRSPLMDDDPLCIGPRRPMRSTQPEWAPPDDPFDIGRGDLDPFAAGIGGGMMFDPLRTGRPHRGIDPSAGLPGPGRLPPGAVPPGARFDPFGPDLDGRGNPRGGGRGGFAGPNPDHLPPPGYDNMFM